MNYIWEVLLKADEENIPREDIKFVQADICSPYMEIALDNLNSNSLPEDNVIEVNEYYRFYEIFKDLFNINFSREQRVKRSAFRYIIALFRGTRLKKRTM